MEAAGCLVADLDRDGRRDLLLTAMAAAGNRLHWHLGERPSRRRPKRAKHLGADSTTHSSATKRQTTCSVRPHLRSFSWTPGVGSLHHLAASLPTKRC